MRPIPGYGGYFADRQGQIWSAFKFRGGGYGRPGEQVNTGVPQKRLKGRSRAADGRIRVTLRRDDGKFITRYRAHFVLFAYVGPRPEGMECLHGNGECTDDSPTNLRWGTSLENKADMVRHGTRQKGRQINTCKLSEADVIEIRRLRSEDHSLKSIAGQFRITEANVSCIVNRKTWTHV